MVSLLYFIVVALASLQQHCSVSPIFLLAEKASKMEFSLAVLSPNICFTYSPKLVHYVQYRVVTSAQYKISSNVRMILELRPVVGVI